MQMQAVVMTATGGPEVLKYTEVQAPRIQRPHDVRVRVRAAGVNPADWQLRTYGMPDFGHGTGAGPWILGMDGAGVVEAVGEAVTRVAPGDEVYYCNGGFGPYPGSYAQYTIVDDRYLAHKPKSLDFTHAAAAPVVLITAWEALYEHARVQAGQYVLVQGGAGGVGHIGIQLAAARGARVAATVSTAAKAALARELGAQRVIRYRDEEVGATVREWTGRDGADVVLDTVGGGVFLSSFALTAPWGTLVGCVDSNWPEGMNSAAKLKNFQLALEHMGAPQVFADHGARVRQTQILEDGAKLFDAGKLRVVLGRVCPLAQAADAHRALEAGEVMGRIVLEIP